MKKKPKIKNKNKDKDNNAEEFKIINESNFMIQTLKDDCTKITKEINLFKIIYTEFPEMDEPEKFEKIKELLSECKKIFNEIEKGNKDILNKWQNKFKNYKGIDEFIKQLKNYDKIKNDGNYKDIVKNILILTKKDVYYSDIKCLLYFFQLFKVEQTDLSKYLIEKKSDFENNESFNFDKLEKIFNYLEEMNIYFNDGKDDSSLIKFVRILYNKKKEINYLKTKEVDVTLALLYKLEPTKYSLKFDDILEYISCINFINDLIKEKTTDKNILLNLKTKLEEHDINLVLSSFNCYFANFEKIKILDSKDLYGNIKYILNNSKFEIQFFKKEFKVYDDNQKEIKDIMARDLDGLIRLKNNININYKDLPDNIKLNNKQIEELNKKKGRIEIFVNYVNNLQIIDKYILKLKNKGFPFFIEIQIITSKDNIIYKLGNNLFEFNELISNLKEYYNTIKQYQLKFYKENEYFRYIYNQQIYRLLKRKDNKNKDISSYIRYFTNDDSIRDDVPLYISKFNDMSNLFNNCEIAIEEKFDFISKYIEHIFKINNISLNKLYENIKIKNGFKGIYKCFIHKYNMELFMVKIFLKLTGTFPIAKNILITTNETSTGEITSFIYRAFKCKFNTLFIISINDDLPMKKIYSLKKILNKIITEMKDENNIKDIYDLNSCILFIIQNKLRNLIFLPEAIDLSNNLIGDENKLEYDIVQLSENKIYNHVRIYSSDCCGLGKSYLIKKEIKERRENYFYFQIGDNITKDGIYKKLKKFLKHDIKGKNKIGIHLDLFYTKDISIMKYFLFSLLITKFYQVNDNILYIPKDINIYVEIPNGSNHFIDDYSLLTIFQRINITLDKQIPLEIHDENIIKNIDLDENSNNLTYIEKSIYINIINYLNKNKNGNKINNEKIKSLFNIITKNIYTKRLKVKEISQKNKTEKEKNDYLFDFYNINEKNLKIEYNVPIIFCINNEYIEIDISDYEIKGKDFDYFIANLKKVISLEKSDEEIKEILGDYKITEDNYRKIILILFRLYANIPIILQGETGCEKTELIKILMKILNKDNENNNLILKNINQNTKENEIEEVIEEANEIIFELKNDFICIFFDEINTNSFPSKMKEIFVNHSLNGIPIDERIRFIGACLPFCKNNDIDNIPSKINPLPNSMLNYILYFKSLDDDDIKKYIENIIDDEFSQDENEEDENSIFKEIALDAIYDSYISLKEYNLDFSVSLRDIKRFQIAYKFFSEYYGFFRKTSR